MKWSTKSLPNHRSEKDNEVNFWCFYKKNGSLSQTNFRYLKSRFNNQVSPRSRHAKIVAGVMRHVKSATFKKFLTTSGVTSNPE